MTKTEALEVLGKLPRMQKVRLTIDLPAQKVDSSQCADYHIYWLTKEFNSPWQGTEMFTDTGYVLEYDEDEEGNFIELDCIQLESSSFDFALAYNSVMNKESQTPETVEYTKEQQEEMWALHFETTQQIHVGYLETSKGE